MKIINTLTTVQLNMIHKNLFVREALDQDRACYFGELIESMLKSKAAGKEPDPDFSNHVRPILVTPAYKVLRGGKLEYLPETPWFEMVDGRHRYEGWDVNSVKEVGVMVAEFDTEVELIAYAYTANTGGTKPPTAADREHTIKILVEKGLNPKAIAEAMGLQNYTSIVRGVVDTIKSKMERTKLVEALRLVENGMTVPKAAEQVGIPEEKVRDAIQGRRRKAKREKDKVADLQRSLTNKYRGASRTNTALLTEVRKKLEDGDLTYKQVLTILEKIDSLQNTALRHTADWRARFEAIVNGTGANKNGQV